jgi:ABC-type uncharacterized transport system involved in gliding motility auxiliary subunit
LRQTNPIPGEIIDLIREYAAHSRGTIRFADRDPARAGLIREVEELGIIPHQIQVPDRTGFTIATVYSGILIEYLDREVVMPVVFALDTLEYDLTSRIRALVRNTERNIGIIVADAHRQLFGEFSLLHRELLFSGFRLVLIGPDDFIPPTLQALIVLGGTEDLELHQLYLIDLYIRGGGNVLFAVDGIKVDIRGEFEARAALDQGLLAMLANYGAVIRRALVLDEASLNFSFQSQEGGATVVQTVRYPHWISVQAGNPYHPVTASFLGLDLFWPSPIELFPPPGVTAEVLFTSSPQAWLQSERFITNPNLLHFFEEERAESPGTRILGVSLSGVFPSAFELSPVSGFNEGQNPSRLIVVASTDFAGDFMQITRGEGRNLDFLIRAVEWLSNDEDIVAIRGRGVQAGRLDRLTDPAQREAAMILSRTINTVIVPLAVALAGAFICVRRKKKTANPQRNSAKGKIGVV